MSLKRKIENKRESVSSAHDLFKNEYGAIDLASIMVGIIVIGLIGGVIASTIFVVIPWAQDNAAKQQLDSIVQAENAYMGMSSAIPSPLPAGSATNSFSDSAGLANANLLQTGPTYCAVTSNGGKSYQGYSASASGSVWSVTDAVSKPFAYTGALPANCQFILAAASSTASPTATATPSPTPTSNDLPWGPQTTAPGNFLATSGNFSTQMSKASTYESISTNSGTSWTTTASTANGDVAAVSENGTYILTGISQSTTGPVYLSTNGGNTWGQITALGNVLASKMWVSNDGSKIVVAANSGGVQSILISTNGGASFTKYGIGSMYSFNGLAVSSDASHIYATATDGYLYITTNGGASWSSKASNNATTGIATDPTGKRVLMSGLANGKVYISNDYGTSFTGVAVGTSTTARRTIMQQAISLDGQNMTVTGPDSTGTQVFISRDGGQTWTMQTNLANAAWVSYISSDGTQFLAAAGANIYRSK